MTLKKNNKILTILECPHCDAGEVLRYSSVKGLITTRVQLNPDVYCNITNEDMYEGIVDYPQKKAYCGDCGVFLGLAMDDEEWREN